MRKSKHSTGCRSAAQALGLLGVLIPLGSVSHAMQQPALQADWVQSPINGHWYGVDYTPRTWTDAEALAVSLGGHLATVRSQAEQDWIASFASPYLEFYGAWIGLNDVLVEGTYEWTSGEPFVYGNDTTGGIFPWATLQPDNSYTAGEDFVHVYGANHSTQPIGSWNDLQESGSLSAPMLGLIELPTKPQVGWSWPRETATGSLPHYTTLGDMDGDGDLDVIVPANGSNQVEIYWNDGAGVLDPDPAVISTPQPFVPMPIDRDQDGDLDLLVTANDGIVGCRLWDNDGAGVFVLGGTPESTRSHGIDIGDIDFDGIEDAVWTVGSVWQNLRPSHFDPVGGISTYPSFVTDSSTHFVRIVDLNADGAPDLVSSSTSDDRIRTWIGDGAGGFSSGRSYDTGADPWQIELADLDNDGDQDIIVAVGSANYIRLYENNGSLAGINLIHQGDFTMGVKPRDVKIHDFNGDGFFDMAAACDNSNDLRIRYGVGPFDFSGPEVIFQNHPTANDLATGDLNGDGLIDLVTTSFGANKITIHLNHFSNDCNGNGIPDSDDIANGSLDCNLNGIPDECEEDCNQNGILDSCDIASGFALDCNQNGVPDWCDINNDPSLDVNLNSIPDSCEGPGRTWILSPVTGNWYAVTDPLSVDQAELQASNWGGHLVTVNDQAENDWLASQFGDATHPFWIGLTDVVQEGVYQWINGEPVGYLNWRAGEPDDAPGVFGADFTILYPPTANWLDEPSVPPTWPLPRGVVELISTDCDDNGLPDVWEVIADPGLDCDDNGVHDSCDLQDPSLDCDGDDVLDSCQIESDPSLDCDGNGSIDSCEIQADGSLDCDGVEGLDSCQIDLDPSLDWDGNDVLDSCAGGGPSYCFGNINAAGNVGSIEASGSPLIADNNLTISSHGLPIGQPGYYLFSANSAYVNPFGGGAGALCLGAPIRRLNHLAGYPVLFVNAAGDVSLTLDLGNLPATILVPGDVYIFQLWHREFDPMGSPTSNTTDSMRVMFR